MRRKCPDGELISVLLLRYGGVKAAMKAFSCELAGGFSTSMSALLALYPQCCAGTALVGVPDAVALYAVNSD